MGKKMKTPPPGLDYRPVTGDTEFLSFGIVQADAGGGKINTAEGAVFRRLYPVMKPDDPALPWTRPTCFKHEVLLPTGASDELWDAQRLARTYDEQGFSVKDVMVIITLRYPQVETTPQQMKLHEAYWDTLEFTRRRIVDVYGVAAICAFHIPARAARPGAPHAHVMVPARKLLPSGYASFAQPLATDEGREIMDREWEAWRRGVSLS